MSINVNDKNLGHATAYAYYKAGGGTMTESEFTEFMADFGTASQTAVEAAQAALASKNAAQTAATTATNKASEATTAATTATTKAGEASTSASTATSAKDTAVSASQTATAKATEATTAAATATSAKTDAVAANTAAQSAKTAAQTAQTGAETAAASVQSSAAQIQTNADDISELKEDFATMESDGLVPSAEQILTDKGITDSVPYHYRKTGGEGADRLYDQIVGGTVCFNQLCNDASVIVQSGRKYLSKIGTAWAVGTSTGTAITGLTSGADMIIDLTTMFGSTIADYIYGLETATAGAGVAWLKAHFPKIFDAGYIPYNAGTLEHVSGLSAHKMVGFNQWDEEWEMASINWSNYMFTPIASGGRLSSKNYIPVLPDTTYYINKYVDNYIAGYDNDNPTEGYPINIVSGRFTTPSNCHFIKFGLLTDNYGKTYNHDICININDPARNGEYEPYKAHSYQLDDSLTLRGLFKLDANNNLYADGDTYDADGTVTRKYGVVDLGTLTWAVASGIFKANVPNFASPADYMSRKAGFICQKYPADTQFSISESAMADKTALRFTGVLYIKDTSYVDISSFKTAMSGVYLVYELATPTTESADPYQHLQQCDPNGTEEYVSTGIVPVGHNTQYPENLRAKIEGLPWDFSSLIAPTERTTTASRNYTAGSLLIMGNVLYKATANIANGGTITPNTNVTATTLSEILSALAQ